MTESGPKLVHLTDDQLLERITTAHRDMERFQSGFLLAVGYFDLRGLARDSGAPSTASFLTRALDIAPSTAYEYVRVANTLVQFQFAAEAFERGEIGYSKIRLLGRYLTEQDEIELVLLAGELSYRELERALMMRKPVDGPTEPKEDRLRFWTDKVTGRLRFSGDLSPMTGAKLFAALKVGELANYVDVEDVDPEVYGDQSQLNEALDAVQEAEPEIPAENEEGEKVSGYGPPAPARMMSALLGLINIALSAPVSKRRAPGAQVHLIHTEDGPSLLPGMPPPDRTAATAAIINGQIRGHLLDNRGNPIKLGRSRRLVSDTQAMALLARWMFQCATPGCTHSRFMEFHHIQDWSAGGLTNPDNLIPLCGFCHSMVTNRIIDIEPDLADATKLYFRYRTGEVYVSRRRGMAARGQPKESTLGAPLPEPALQGIDFGTDGNDWAYFGG